LESLLIITGSMGAGKSAVMAEASDMLGARGIVHAAIDLDALGLAHLGSGSMGKAAVTDRVMWENLRSVSANYARVGVRRFLVARAMEDEAELRLCRETIPAPETKVCRLTASIEVMKRRVEMRESGMLQKELVARVEVLNAILERAGLEDFTVMNEGRPIGEVAMKVLTGAGWILS
jgi:phosphosulfolactate synthase (CoM biosynthesis protein A)